MSNSIINSESKLYHVVGNYGSTGEIIKAGNYGRKWGLAKSSPENIPIVIQPVNQKTRLVPLGETRTVQEIYDLYPKASSPLTVLTYGAAFPEELKNGPIFTVYKNGKGQFFYVCLRMNGNDRYVDANECYPSNEFIGRFRLLEDE